MNFKNNAPCMGCEDRHEGCHAKCPKYQAFVDERKAGIKEAELQRIPSEYNRATRRRYFMHKLRHSMNSFKGDRRDGD